MLKNKFFKAIAWTLLISMAPLSVTGCYGTFPLVKTVYKANGSIENGVLEQIAFWFLTWIPIYGLAALGDLVIFNLLEFWSGAGGVDVSSTTLEDGTQLTLAPGADDNEAILTASKDGVTQQVRFVRISDSECKIYDEQDRLAGWVRSDSEGGFQLTDLDGNVLETIPGTMLAEIL